MDAVVAPPYDVISPDARDALYRSSPFNVTRLILNPEGHEAAGVQYRAWRERGVLRADERPAFYLYSQEFDADGPKRRVGVIGAMYLEPFTTGVVRPHERTFSHHKKDRLELTTQVQANLSPIFGLYSNPDFIPAPEGGWSEPPLFDVVHEGVRNRLWAITSAESVSAITEAVRGRTVFIADGHHRYETALNYFAQERPGATLAASDGPDDAAEPAAHVMAFLAAFEDPGMVILPTHRELLSLGGATPESFVAKLSEVFSIERVPATADGRDRLSAHLRNDDNAINVFGLALHGSAEYLLLRRSVDAVTSPVRRLDVAVLQDLVLERIAGSMSATGAEVAYSPDTAAVLERVRAGKTVGALLMRPTRADQLAEVCMAGELMPQKSTYFYPKLLTGLVFHALAR